MKRKALPFLFALLFVPLTAISKQIPGSDNGIFSVQSNGKYLIHDYSSHLGVYDIEGDSLVKTIGGERPMYAVTNKHYNYYEDGNPASCDIKVGYGYRVCNGKIESYIDRLFVPPGSCYTEVRNKYGFYERCENELTIHLADLLGIPSNGASYQFNHWRPGSCNALCWNTDNSGEAPIMVAQIFVFGDGFECCLETITATRDLNGDLTTDFNYTSNYTPCDDDPNIPPLQVCEYLGDCLIECR
jgi:hypothetical protein